MTNSHSKPVQESIDAGTAGSPGSYTSFDYQPRQCPKYIFPDVQCPGVTKLDCCRGTTQPEKNGYWYERCDLDKRHPGLGKDRHFIRWCNEYERYAPLPVLSIDQILDPYPTPTSSPSKPPPSPIASHNSSTPSPHNVQTQIEGLIYAIERTQASRSSPDPSRKDVRKLTSARLGLATNNSDPPLTQSIFGPEGNSNTSTNPTKCQGPLCSTPAGATLKPAKACTFKFCKRCCLDQQSSTSKACRYHKPEVASTSVSTSSLSQTGFYDRSKPLTEEHYNLKIQAQANALLANHRTEQARLEKELGAQIEILFWDNDGDEEPQTFTVACKEYPLFTLGGCLNTVLKRLNLSPSCQEPADFIETFNPAHDRWINHDINTIRNVANTKTLLYRALGLRSGECMDREQNVLSLCGKSRKRPVTETDFIDGPYRTQRTKYRHSIELREASPLNEDGLSSSDSSPHPNCSSPLTRQSLSPPPEVSKAFADIFSGRSLVQDQSAVKRTKCTSEPPLNLTNTPFGSIPMDLEPSSAKGPFPLKYVISMVRLFTRMASMKSGTVEHRFRASFPSGYVCRDPWPHSSYFASHGLWTNSAGDLAVVKAKFLQAGYSSEGLWKMDKGSHGTDLYT